MKRPDNWSDMSSHERWEWTEHYAMRLEYALRESVKLQSHYATLLNQYDGGERLEFKNVEEWLERLEECSSQEHRTKEPA